jgi:hypothetical protein
MMAPQRSLAALAIAAALVAAPLAAQEQPVEPTRRGTLAEGMNDGTLRGNSVGTGGYFAGGFASGLMLGLIGTGLAYVVASSSDVGLPAAQVSFADRSPEYIQGYAMTYGQRVKSRRTQSALAGGLLGNVALLVIVMSMVDY